MVGHPSRRRSDSQAYRRIAFPRILRCSEETTTADVVSGLALARLVGELRGLPVRLVTAPAAFAGAPEIARSGVPVLPIERRMLPPWLRAPEACARAAAPRATPLGRRTLSPN